MIYQYREHYSEKELEIINYLEAAGVDLNALVAGIAEDAYQAGFEDGKEYFEYCQNESYERQRV